MVLHKINYGCLYRSQTDEWYFEGDKADITAREADFLGDKVECIFSMEEFLNQNVGPISESIETGERDDILHDIWDAEGDGKERVTVVKAVRNRLEKIQ